MFCVVPALIATLACFPMMVTSNRDSTLSMTFVIAIMISLLVILNAVIKSFKNKTLFSVSLILAGLTAVFIGAWVMEKDTIKGLAWVSGCASVGVMLGCACFRLHDMWNDLYKHCGEVYVR
jgi:hypothetical protein